MRSICINKTPYRNKNYLKDHLLLHHYNHLESNIHICKNLDSSKSLFGSQLVRIHIYSRHCSRRNYMDKFVANKHKSRFKCSRYFLSNHNWDLVNRNMSRCQHRDIRQISKLQQLMWDRIHMHMLKHSSIMSNYKLHFLLVTHKHTHRDQYQSSMSLDILTVDTSMSMRHYQSISLLGTLFVNKGICKQDP